MGTIIGGKLPWGGGNFRVGDRVEATVALVERRGYALPASRLGELCLGGPRSEAEVLKLEREFFPQLYEMPSR